MCKRLTKVLVVLPGVKVSWPVVVRKVDHVHPVAMPFDNWPSAGIAFELLQLGEERAGDEHWISSAFGIAWLDNGSAGLAKGRDQRLDHCRLNEWLVAEEENDGLDILGKVIERRPNRRALPRRIIWVEEHPAAGDVDVLLNHVCCMAEDNEERIEAGGLRGVDRVLQCRLAAKVKQLLRLAKAP